MMRLFCLAVASLLLGSGRAHAQQGGIADAYQTAGGAAALKVTEWRADRKTVLSRQLAGLPADVKDVFVARAGETLKMTWPLLTAGGYLEFSVNGNRSRYETVFNKRRFMLKDLVIGELLERKGRFLPMIADGIWLICEESTWSLPATLDVDRKGYGLPQPEDPIVDLTVAQTAVLLAWTNFLLKEGLDQVNKNFSARIKVELEKRVIEPFNNHNDFWWMGFTGRKPNNWNIYCNYYMLMTALLAVDDQVKRDHVFEKAIRSADIFFFSYPQDGGCDEGPKYWNMAGGTLGMFIKTLADLSEKRINFTNIRKMHDIGSYLSKVHVGGNSFVNFADATVVCSADPAKLFAFGTLYNDLSLKQFAAYFFKSNWNGAQKIQSDEINVFLHNLMLADTLLRIEPGAPLKEVNWLPDLQIVSAREKQGSEGGLFFAAKGGHNAESHNHNDIGNFVLFLDGKPMIIDVGIGTYAKETFSEDRWKIWNIRSLWHNCPLINGQQQPNGSKYVADKVQFRSDGRKTFFTLDLAKAYAPEAGVSRWLRSFIYDRKTPALEMREDYGLSVSRGPTELSFITHLPLNRLGDGLVIIGNGSKRLKMKYNPLQFDFDLATQELKDPRLIQPWGKQVQRIILRFKHNTLKGSHSVRFSVTQ